MPSLVVPPPSPPSSRTAAARAPVDEPPASVRRGTLKMHAVKAEEAPSSGRMLDAVDFTDAARVSLELGALPAGRALALGRPPTPLSTPRTPGALSPGLAHTPEGRVLPGPPVGGSAGVRRPEMVDPRRPGIFAFAGFGLPPESAAGAPAYAVRVLLRKRILRGGLAVAKRQRSPDVELYEAALRTADPAMYAKGLLALVLAALSVVVIVGVGLVVLG